MGINIKSGEIKWFALNVAKYKWSGAFEKLEKREH